VKREESAAAPGVYSRFTFHAARLVFTLHVSHFTPYGTRMAQNKSRLQAIRERALSLWDESIFRSGGEPTRFYKFLHFWMLVIKSFARNRGPLRASALSYTSLLALIPMLAVAMSVTTSLLKKEGQEQIELFIDKFVSSVTPPAETETNSIPASSGTNGTAVAVTSSDAPDAGAAASGSNFLSNASQNTTNQLTTAGPADKPPTVEKHHEVRLTDAQRKVAAQIYGFIKNIQSGAIAGVGMLLLVYAAIRMLSQIESTFNDIWGVTRGRGWATQILLYWGTITLGPLVLAGVVGLASGPHFQSTQKLLEHMPHIHSMLFKVVPLVVVCITFALFYKTVPNTKVHFSAALVGGAVGGTAWHVNNVFGFLYVSRVVTNSKIYGSLALLPVFMIGLYFSWVILLFGAQVAYAFQNRSLYLQEKLAENVNQRGREFVALRLMTCIGQQYQRGLPPATIQQMSSELGIPSRLVQQVLQTLLAAHLVAEVAGAEAAYIPARPLENINAHHVLMAMRATQGQELVTRDEPVREEVYGEFARIQEAERRVASGISILTLVNRAQARLEISPPPAAEEEIKFKGAFIPPAEQAAAALREALESSPTSDSPEPVGVESAHGAGTKKANPEPANVVVQTKETRPADEIQIARTVVAPQSDEEREFPL
jgi:membrane protein